MLVIWVDVFNETVCYAGEVSYRVLKTQFVDEHDIEFVRACREDDNS